MDPQTGNNNKLLTNGQDTWSARCGESRTPGAGGDLRETTGGNAGTAPAGLPHARPGRAHQRHRTRAFKTKVIGALRRLQKLPHIVRAFFADPDLRYITA